MKTLRRIIAAVVLAFSMLSAPAFAVAPSDIHSVHSTGVTPLPDRPGFALRGYYLNRRGWSVGHYVYILEFEGKPYAGTGTSFSSGKNPVTSQLQMGESVDSKPLTCTSVAQCEKALAQMKEQELLRSAQTCSTIAECEKRLEAAKRAGALR